MQPQYRQVLENSHINTGIAHVNVGKYIFSHKNKTDVLKTLLGSCVALIGSNEEGYGFMTHVFFHRDVSKMISELRRDVQVKTGYILEDFHLTITGGNNVAPEIKLDPGKLNIEAVLRNLQRKPDAKIHLGKNTGNTVRLTLASGQIESRGISN